MSRTVENAIFAHLHGRARENQIEQIIGQYSPTKKNAPVVDLFPKLGFTENGLSDDASNYQYDIGADTPENPYVTIQEGA